MKLTNSKLGQSIIELLIVMSLMTILLPVLGYGFMTSREGKAQQKQRLQATALHKQASEAVRSFRDSGWNNFAINGTYHSEVNGSMLILVPGTDTKNGFIETIVISDARRNDSLRLVESGGTVDPSTKMVSITISWNTPRPSQISSTSYFVRLENIAKSYTTSADFLTGNTAGTVVVGTEPSEIPDDAEIHLGAGGGGGNWCDPSKSITSVDLPKSGVANAISAIEGMIFAGTGENASGISFGKVTTTIEQDPPVAQLEATFTGYKTNAVFGDEDFAYLTTDNNSKEVVMIDLNSYSDSPTNSKYAEAGSINLPGNIDGTSIFVKGNIAYVTGSDSRLYIYNISNKSSPSLLNSGGLTLSGIGRKVLITGNYAYLAVNSTSNQLQIVNISNPASPSVSGSLNLGTGQSGVDLYVNITNPDPARAYLVTTPSTGNKNFYIVNVSNPASPNISGMSSYDTAGMTPTGVTVVTGNKAIIVGTGGTNQYQVVDITNETGTLSACANLQYSTGIKGVSSVLQSNGYAYSYIVTGDASSELKIILGGGGGNYSNAGTYTSEAFDTQYETAFNRFIGTVNLPPQTTLRMQISVSQAVSDSCENVEFVYVGPDPADYENSYYIPEDGILSGVVPYRTNGLYSNPGRCFSYRLYMTSNDTTATPTLYDFDINYSP